MILFDIQTFPAKEDLFEKKPSVRHTISDPFLLRRVDIESWSDDITKALENNALNHCVDKCDSNINECTSINRLVFVLKLYNQCVNHKTDVKFVINIFNNFYLNYNNIFYLNRTLTLALKI